MFVSDAKFWLEIVFWIVVVFLFIGDGIGILDSVIFFGELGNKTYLRLLIIEVEGREFILDEIIDLALEFCLLFFKCKYVVLRNRYAIIAVRGMRVKF